MVATQRFGGRRAALAFILVTVFIDVLGGLLGQANQRLPFWAAAGLALVGAGTRWHIPGASFLLAAVLMLVALAVALTINARAAANVGVAGESHPRTQT